MPGWRQAPSYRSRCLWTSPGSWIWTARILLQGMGKGPLSDSNFWLQKGSKSCLWTPWADPNSKYGFLWPSSCKCWSSECHRRHFPRSNTWIVALIRQARSGMFLFCNFPPWSWFSSHFRVSTSCFCKGSYRWHQRTQHSQGVWPSWSSKSHYRSY